MDVLYIGNQYLGFYEKKPEYVCCSKELLKDMIQSGVFGGQEKSDYAAANTNLALEDDRYGQGMFNTLFRAVFPKRKVLLAGYPYLEKKPWMLPVVWGKRWIKFIRYAGKDVWKLGREIMKKSSARMKMIKNTRSSGAKI